MLDQRRLHSLRWYLHWYWNFVPSSSAGTCGRCFSDTRCCLPHAHLSIFLHMILQRVCLSLMATGCDKAMPASNVLAIFERIVLPAWRNDRSPQPDFSFKTKNTSVLRVRSIRIWLRMIHDKLYSSSSAARLVLWVNPFPTCWESQHEDEPLPAERLIPRRNPLLAKPLSHRNRLAQGQVGKNVWKRIRKGS